MVVLKRIDETGEQLTVVLKLPRFSLGEGKGVDGEIRVFVTVMYSFAFLDALKGNVPARVTLHEPDVVENLTPTYATDAVVTEEGFLTALHEILNVVMVESVAEAFVERLVADGGVFVYRHGIIFRLL